MRHDAPTDPRGGGGATAGVAIDDIVELSLPVVTAELARAMDEAFAGEPLCVEGADPTEVPEPAAIRARRLPLITFGKVPARLLTS